MSLSYLYNKRNSSLRKRKYERLGKCKTQVTAKHLECSPCEELQDLLLQALNLPHLEFLDISRSKLKVKYFFYLPIFFETLRCLRALQFLYA
jgi:hypothetical protein